MKDELEGGRIIEFVSGGPKQYGYRMINTSGKIDTAIKIRGITLNRTTSNVTNFKTLKNKVTSYLAGQDTEPLMVTLNSIRREKNREVVTKTIRKKI